MMTWLSNLAGRLSLVRILNDIIVLAVFVKLVWLDLHVVLVHDDVRIRIRLLCRLDLVHVLFENHHLFRILIVSNW